MLRWYVKKLARAGLGLGGQAMARPGASPRVRVLTYHRFGPSGHDPFCVATQAFAAQMEWLASRGAAISLAKLERHLDGTAAIDDGSALVTIDDGYRSLYTHALPILRHFDIPAVAYLPAGLLPGGDATPAGAEPRLSWSEVEALAAGGVTIGSHAWSHRSLGAMSPASAHDEIRRSRERLEARTGSPVTSFAYPFGTRADYTAATRTALAECGYRTAFTSQHGAIDRDSDALELPRIKIEGGEPLWMFTGAVRGAMDSWRWVDRTLWRLQARSAQAEAA
jgi:peptidoglycan/xylan/chitin deacetylase (PgdA/CDA1 family)